MGASIYNTYSFADSTGVFSHSGVGQKVLTGEGVGDIAFNMANDVTVHDTAADGHVMVSKIASGSGSFVINVQQTSHTNNYLTKYYNYVTAATSDQWAKATFNFRNSVTGEEYSCEGVSPQKLPDRSYQAQGQRVSWSFMSAKMTYNPGSVIGG